VEYVFTYLLTGFVLLGSLYAVWLLSGRRFVLSPPTIFVSIYILYHIPLALMVSRDAIGFLLLVDMGLVCFVVGTVLASDGRSIIRETRQALAKTIQLDWPPSTVRSAVILMILLATGIALLYYQGLPPLLDVYEPLMAGDIKAVMSTLSHERETLTKAHYFGGRYRGQGVLEVANQEAWKYLLVLAALMATITNRRAFKLLALLTAVLTYVFVAGGAERAPFVWAVIAVLIAFSYTRQIPPARWMKWGASIFVILMLLTLMTPKYSIEGNIIVNIANAIVARIFWGNGLASLHLYQLVQDGTLSVQYGLEHVRLFMNALPGIHSSAPLAHELLFLTDPHARPWSTTYLSHTYLGLIYVDFGAPGVAVILMPLGWALQRLHLLILRSRREILTVSFLAIVALHAGRIVNTSIVNFFPPVLVLAVIHLITVLTMRMLGPPRSTNELRSKSFWRRAGYRRCTQ
jgi:hypothetical protein